MREWLNDLIMYVCQLALCESTKSFRDNKGQSRRLAAEDTILWGAK